MTTAASQRHYPSPNTSTSAPSSTTCISYPASQNPVGFATLGDSVTYLTIVSLRCPLAPYTASLSFTDASGGQVGLIRFTSPTTLAWFQNSTTTAHVVNLSQALVPGNQYYLSFFAGNCFFGMGNIPNAPGTLLASFAPTFATTAFAVSANAVQAGNSAIGLSIMRTGTHTLESAANSNGTATPSLGLPNIPGIPTDNPWWIITHLSPPDWARNEAAKWIFIIVAILFVAVFLFSAARSLGSGV